MVLGEKRLDFLRNMIRIREFEESLRAMYFNGELFGVAPHTSCGQEAMAVGVCSALMENDYILTTHRGHGHCIAKGAEMKYMLAELFGKPTGYCKGRGGTMHIADISHGILGANGVVAAGMPMANGVGLAIKRKGTRQVCVCFFGDGASNQGAFYESLNFAAVFKLPVVFVCENNMYGLSTPYKNVSPRKNVTDGAEAYFCIPSTIVDGMMVNEVYQATLNAVAQARECHSPSLIEGKTYRYYGHNVSEQRSYRTKEEVEEVRKNRDPIMLLEKELLKEGLITEQAIKRLEQEARDEVADARDFAIISPAPDVNKIMDDVFCEK